MHRARTRKSVRRIAPMVLALVGLALAGCSDNREATSPTGPRNLAPSFQVVPGSGRWVTEQPMPTPRFSLATASLGGLVYAVGGQTTNSCTGYSTVEAYDPVTGSWNSKTSMLIGRTALAVGAANGLLYALGGGVGCGVYVASVEAYDPATNSWNSKASMAQPRYLPAVGVIDGTMYAVGGLNGGGLLAALEAYDPTTNTWTVKSPMPTPRYRLGVGVINGTLYAVGGYDGHVGDGGMTTVVETYDPGTNIWSTKAPLPGPRTDLAVAVVNGILYAAGGYGPGGEILNTVEAYDPTTDTWTAQAPMPTSRVDLGLAVVGSTLYAVGGYNSNEGALATNEALPPKTDQTITFGPLSNRTFGDPPFPISASATSGLTVSFTASGSCTASGSTVSLTGVGTCTITADQAGDDDFNPASSVQQSFAVLYNTAVGHGFLQPINTPPQQQSVFKIGSTIPVKFQLFLADGVTPVSTALATIQINKVSNGVPSGENEAVTSTVPNQGINFRYDATSQQYIFNLGTKGWTSGTYQITALLNDGSNITVNVGAR